MKKYKIFVAFNHYLGVEIWQVIGIDNDYVGEYHENIDDAIIELITLKTIKHVQNLCDQ